MSQVVNDVDSDDVAESLDALEPEADTANLSKLRPKVDVLKGEPELDDMDDFQPEEAEEAIAMGDITPEDLEDELMEEDLDEEAGEDEDNLLRREVKRKLESGQDEFEPGDFEEADDDDYLNKDLEEVA